VFVAMSFDARFEARWKAVLEPAIRSVGVDGRSLMPFRVDACRVSDSILTEIVVAIANARLVLADLTTLHVLNGYTARNANVFYEVGIAHAVRLPEEVLLFRSDNDGMAFDIANVRVNSYDPDGQPAEAQHIVAEAISSALREIDLRRSLAVQSAINSLDGEAFEVLVITAQGQMKQPKGETLGQFPLVANQLRALDRLLDMGLIQPAFPSFSVEQKRKLLTSDAKQFMYLLTDFGKVVAREATDRLARG
jgi:hypothetical protein